MTSSLFIRPVQESDKSTIWQLFIEMMRHWLTIRTPNRDWALHHIQGHLNHLKEIFLVALVDSQPVGVILVRLTSNKVATVFGAYVKPDFRQRGIMRAIGVKLEEALHERGISEINSQVQSNNRIGCLVLKTFGFKAVSIIYRKEL